MFKPDIIDKVMAGVLTLYSAVTTLVLGFSIGWLLSQLATAFGKSMP